MHNFENLPDFPIFSGKKHRIPILKYGAGVYFFLVSSFFAASAAAAIDLITRCG